MTEEQPPTQEELIAAWKESLERKRNGLGQIANAPDLQTQGNSAIHGKPSLSYAEMKQEFDKRRGVSRGNWETLDNTEHDISNTPSPQTGRLRDPETGNFIDYATAKEMFYAKTGRQSPEMRQKQMDERKKQYGRV